MEEGTANKRRLQTSSWEEKERDVENQYLLTEPSWVSSSSSRLSGLLCFYLLLPSLVLLPPPTSTFPRPFAVTFECDNIGRLFSSSLCRCRLCTHTSFFYIFEYVFFAVQYEKSVYHIGLVLWRRRNSGIVLPMPLSPPRPRAFLGLLPLLVLAFLVVEVAEGGWMLGAGAGAAMMLCGLPTQCRRAVRLCCTFVLPQLWHAIKHFCCFSSPICALIIPLRRRGLGVRGCTRRCLFRRKV